MAICSPAALPRQTLIGHRVRLSLHLIGGVRVRQPRKYQQAKYKRAIRHRQLPLKDRKSLI
jgi:hypothetical protein